MKESKFDEDSDNERASVRRSNSVTSYYTAREGTPTPTPHSDGDSDSDGDRDTDSHTHSPTLTPTLTLTPTPTLTPSFLVFPSAPIPSTTPAVNPVLSSSPLSPTRPFVDPLGLLADLDATPTSPPVLLDSPKNILDETRYFHDFQNQWEDSPSRKNTASVVSDTVKSPSPQLIDPLDGSLLMQDLEELQSTTPPPMDVNYVTNPVESARIQLTNLIIPESSLIDTPQTIIQSTVSSLRSLRNSILVQLNASSPPSFRIPAEDLSDAILVEINRYQQFLDSNPHSESDPYDVISNEGDSNLPVKIELEPESSESDTLPPAIPAFLPNSPSARRSSIISSNSLRPRPTSYHPSEHSEQNLTTNSIETGTVATPPAGPHDNFRWLPMRRMAESVNLLKLETGNLTAFAVSKYGVFLGSEKSVIEVDFKQEVKFVYHVPAVVTCVAVSWDSGLLCAGLNSGVVVVWDFKRRVEVLRVEREHDCAVVHVDFVGKDVVSADSKGAAFYHSISRIMLMTSVATTRIHGRPTGNVPPTTVYAMRALQSVVGRHPAESLGLVAIVTPYKVAIMNMKPTPQIQFKMAWARNTGTENPAADVSPGQAGAVAWCPCLKRKIDNKLTITDPVLACSSGSKLFLIRVCAIRTPVQPRTTVASSGTPPVKTNIGIEYRVTNTLTLNAAIVALEWLSEKTMLVLTSDQNLLTIDAKTMRQMESMDVKGKEILRWDPHTDALSGLGISPVFSFAGSVCVFKGRVFLLGRTEVAVASQLSWTDRTQALVRSGDSPSAITLALEYYDGILNKTATGLPEDENERHQVVSDHVVELLLNYLTMATSGFDDQQGLIVLDSNAPQVAAEPSSSQFLDPTFYQQLATDAFVTLHKVQRDSLLFNEVYDIFATNATLLSFYLYAFESYVISYSLAELIPPAIVKSFVETYHNLYTKNHEKQYLTRLEDVILNISVSVLDLDFVLNLCTRNSLHRLLCAVYNRGLNDFTTPIKQLLKTDTEESLYILFVYLSYVLTGKTFPEAERDSDPVRAVNARIAVYEYIFSPSWVDDDDVEIGDLPFPYIRHLLNRDYNTFISTMGLAFEDAALNGELKLSGTQSDIDRQMLLDALLVVAENEENAVVWSWKVYAFVARCVRLYSTFLAFERQVFRRIVLNLIESGGDKRERQAAMLDLFAVVNVEDVFKMEEIIELCLTARLFKMLEYLYLRSQRYHLILESYLNDDDDDERKSHAFESIRKLLNTEMSIIHAFQLRESIMLNIIGLIALNVKKTVALVADYFGTPHHLAVVSSRLKGEQNIQYAYLTGLFGSVENPELYEPELYEMYIELMCVYEKEKVIKFLETLVDFEPYGRTASDDGVKSLYSKEKVLELCIRYGVVDAAVWLHTRVKAFKDALNVVITLEIQPAVNELLDVEKNQRPLSEADATAIISKVTKSLEEALNVCQRAADYEEEENKKDALQAISVNVQGHQHADDAIEQEKRRDERRVKKEDLWFTLVDALVQPQIVVIDMLQTRSKETQDKLPESILLDTLQALTRMVLTSMVGHVSLPNIFNHAVKSNPAHSTDPSIGDYRALLTSLFEYYRYESEMVSSTNRIIETDVYKLQRRVLSMRRAAVKPTRGICAVCLRILHLRALEKFDDSIIVFRCSHAYHRPCLTAVASGNTGYCIVCAEEERARVMGEPRMKGSKRKKRAADVLKYLQQARGGEVATSPISPDGPDSSKGKGKQRAEPTAVDKTNQQGESLIEQKINSRIADYERFKIVSESPNWMKMLRLFESTEGISDNFEYNHHQGDVIDFGGSREDFNNIPSSPDLSDLGSSYNRVSIAEAERMSLPQRVLEYRGRNVGGRNLLSKLQLAPPPTPPARKLEVVGFEGSASAEMVKSVISV